MISGVTVADVDPFGKGGLAKIIGGGLNKNNVTIRFTSKPGEAMLFRVVVTGYCLNSYQPNQSFGWAEPLRSFSRFHYNASHPFYNNSMDSIYNNSAMHHPPPPATSEAPPKKPWWHFW